MKNTAVVVTKNADGSFSCGISEYAVPSVEDEQILIKVSYSSLNYKDALSAQGHPGVSRRFPHVTGIDAIGEVVASKHSAITVGDRVLVTGFDLGMNTPGGHQQYLCVPGNWAIVVNKLDDVHYMLYGTAGLTAALSVHQVLSSGVTKGHVLVTGASGGVGSLAVSLLAQLGIEVTAVSNKTEKYPMLQNLGASHCIDRETLTLEKKPLATEQYDAVIDVAGGEILASALKKLKYGGVATCCGLTASGDLHTTVYPFILRGIRLIGVDSVQAPISHRKNIWQHLETNWCLAMNKIAHTIINITEVPELYSEFICGRIAGRVVVRIAH